MEQTYFQCEFPECAELPKRLSNSFACPIISLGAERAKTYYDGLNVDKLAELSFRRNPITARVINPLVSSSRDYLYVTVISLIF